MSDIVLSLKQDEAFEYLQDSTTKELLFGGGAGGAKSFIGCLWLVQCCIQYPSTRWLMGRTKLKSLKDTTLNTFFDVCKMAGAKPDIHYKYKVQEGKIVWSNGSEILLKDLFLYPSDPNFDSLGSLEITGAFIDEANQCTQKAVTIVQSRIRYKLDKYGLIPKILYTCNPAKNWVYTEFYKPDKEGTLEPHRKFVQALATDNPYISEHYIQNLRQMKDNNARERLLYGNWEYDDDPTTLVDFDAITDLWTNEHVQGGQKYITADIARQGNDKTVIGVWNGLRLERIEAIDKSDLVYVKDRIRALATQYGVSISKVKVDEDGLGGGVMDMLRCKGFIANSRAIGNYNNKKSECGYMLADKINSGELYISQSEHKERMIKELEQLKSKTLDKDTKNAIITKDEMKGNIGHSPDFLDMLIMRMDFEIKKGRTRAVSFG